MSKQVPFEQGDMDWLKRIITPKMDHLYNNILSHGRTERIIKHITKLEAQVERYKDALIAISLNSQNTMGGNSTDLGIIARAALEEKS